MAKAKGKAKRPKAKSKVIDPDAAVAGTLYEGPDEKEPGDDSYEVDEGYVKRWVLECYQESYHAKWDRMQQTKQNFDVYHLRHDFAHKIPGQSREILSMQPMAVEGTASLFQQSLVDEGDWWGADAADPKSEPNLKVRPDVIVDLTQSQLNKADMIKHVGVGIKSGILGGKIISKVTGQYKAVPTYVANRSPDARKATLKKIDKKAWQLKIDLVSQKNYYPDPTGAGLYEIEEMWVDYHTLCALAEGPDAIYDKEIVEQIECLKGDIDGEEALDQRRRTDQNTVSHGFRNIVKLKEYWGTILDEDGEVLFENVVCTLANDQWLIRSPAPNPNWHQESPYECGALLDVPDAVWPKALADAGTKHNIALTELYNLMVDGGMNAVNNIRMLRTDWVEDPSKLENGIKAGATIEVSSSCPPGGKVLEMVQSGTVPPDAQAMFNIQRQEFNAAMLTSDIRSGIQPRRDVPATQIVETSQTITSVFKGISTQLEQKWIKGILRKSWMTICQFSDEIDEQEVRALLGDRADAWLKLTPEERFAETVQGIHFSVFGITQHQAKAQDFQKYMTLLQTIGGAQPLMEAFTKKYSMEETLDEVMKALSLPVRRLEISQAEQEMMAGPPQGGPQPEAPAGPDMMSQVGSPTTGSAADTLGQQAGPQANIPQAKFPASKATPRGGM